MAKRDGARHAASIGQVLSVILALATLLAGASPAKERERPSRRGAGETIRVGIPDGLYLYRQDFIANNFSPLLLVRDGRLVDPYREISKVGLEGFMAANAAGRTFDVYAGAERLGRMTDLQMEGSDCDTEGFSPDIQGDGVYDGRSFASAPEPDFAIGEGRVIHGSTRVILAPESYRPPTHPVYLELTQADKKHVLKAAKGGLVAENIKPLMASIEKDGDRFIGEEGRLDFVEAVDLDGNGKKDFVGVYYLIAKAFDKRAGLYRYPGTEILFVLRDSGRMEKIAESGTIPVILVAGCIDLDRDGQMEIVYVRAMSRRYDSGSDGKRIEIVRHSSSGWKRVYKTMTVCSQ